MRIPRPGNISGDPFKPTIGGKVIQTQGQPHNKHTQQNSDYTWFQTINIPSSAFHLWSLVSTQNSLSLGETLRPF